MTLHQSIQENLHFLLSEITSHLALLKQYLDQPSHSIAKRLVARQGYVESLRHTIHNRALGQMTCSKQEAERQRYRSVEIIATYLERIAELCRDAAGQGMHMHDHSQMPLKLYQKMLERIDEVLILIEPALNEQSTRQALKIGKVEQQLDLDYCKLLKERVKTLSEARFPADSITQILLAYRIEQMGDALLGISEAIISACMGQQISTERFHALSASIGDLKVACGLDDVQVVSLAQTRSGSAVNALSGGDEVYHGVFKDGHKRKLKEERQRVKDWHDILPGLAPKILSYQKQGNSASLLIEHLAGETFEQILLQGSDELLQEAFVQLTKTLRRIWRETRNDKPVSADYTGQLSKRLSAVYDIHPEFHASECVIGDWVIPSFKQQMTQLKVLEKQLQAPFSVYIHGDFNIDNIIYDPGEGRINFIDLHRSRYMDYLQDVSVFMVSCYRLQVFDPIIRRRIQLLCRKFYRFVRLYARKQGDSSFEIRLALGLIRSFVTSTRFILDKSLSQAMFHRARYLTERLLEKYPEKQAFKVPIKELFVG
jgi:aminoglycoside phosphotransferase (APT) family kinase protein